MDNLPLEILYFDVFDETVTSLLFDLCHIY